METKTISSAKDVVLSFLKALNENDFNEARKYAKEDLKFDGVLGKRDNANDYFNDMEKMKLKYDIKKVVADREEVSVLYEIDMGGAKVPTTGWYTVKENRIASIRVIFDPRPVLEKNNQNINVRYIVKDVNAAVSFYKDILDFKVVLSAPGFAMLEKDNLHLFINKPGAGGAGAAMPDGVMPEPGGWNRFQLVVKDLDQVVQNLKKKNAQFRNEIVKANAGNQVLLQDPSGNVIELFEYNKQS